MPFPGGHCRALALLLFAAAGAAAGERTVELSAPLTTLVRCTGALPDHPGAIEVVLEVGDDAPGDLGIGAWLADDEGLWFQRLHPRPLGPGRHELRFPLGETAAVHGEPHRGAWTPYHATLCDQAGVFLWSATDSRATIRIERLAVVADEALEPTDELDLDGRRLTRRADEPRHHLADLRLDGYDRAADLARGRTGRRWSLSCVPRPFPAQPYATASFELEAVVRTPAGEEERIAGFYREPMELVDRGDHEEARPAAPARFELRYRPRRPGTYAITVVASWNRVERARIDLPPLVVTGPPWDDYVRVDAEDPRFFATGGAGGAARFHWPIGINLRSVNDPRGAERTSSRLTPDRGWHAYRAYLARLAAAGVDTVEIWLSSWNVALEWRDDWPGFHGIGRYSQAAAERLDRILDTAREHGVRVVLVVHNHGQASDKTDREWHDNPWNRRLRDGRSPDAVRAGPIDHAHEYFTDPLAKAGQERLRRYLVARYADDPAILAWKLWSEINLTAGRRDDVRAWHRAAAARWHALDPYRHPVTTHWSGNYRTPDRAIVALPGIDFVAIDAYHGRKNGQGRLLAELVWDGVAHPTDGLGRFRKPVLITEFGGNWNAAPQPQLIAEHRSGPWAALVSGNGGTPMLWWFEWVDQGERWAPYTAVSRFVAGEDLRSTANESARPAELPATSEAGALWCRAWVRPGRLLGYCLDRGWGFDGERDPEHTAAEVVIGDDVAEGAITVEWWDAERGTIVDRQAVTHDGGRLALRPPPFRRHIAFKLYRR